jgi:hypothetical protein
MITIMHSPFSDPMIKDGSNRHVSKHLYIHSNTAIQCIEYNTQNPSR